MFQKKVLVTGASRGIGKSIIESFFSEDSILIGTATSEAGIKSILENFSNAGVTGKAYLLDLNEDESIKSFIENLKKDDMNPDVLINNAGITKDNLMLRMSEDDWNDVINISSAAAAIGNKGQANYVAAKAGIEAMSKSLAREVGIKNITVNCIAPGFIETDMTKDLDSDYIKTIQSGIPLERLGKPEEVASLVKYISSDDANYITGQTIHINGGLYM